MSNLQYYWHQVLMFFGWRSRIQKRAMAPLPPKTRETLRRMSREGTLPRRCLKKEQE